MPDIIDELSSCYPYLYHMAVRGSRSSIDAAGLMSSADLCDLLNKDLTEKTAFLARLRPDSIEIGQTVHGRIVLRDQKPMSERSLADSLTDMTSEEWLNLLNSRVFLWPNKDRLRTMMNARPYRNELHEVFVFRAETLLRAYAENVWISPINSGATIPWKHPRGSKTFVRVRDFDLAGRIAKAGRSKAVAEFVLDCKLHPIADHLVTHATIGVSGIPHLP